MLLTVNLKNLQDVVINHIKNFSIDIYHQYKPKNVKPPLIVYRTEIDQSEKTRKYLKILNGRNIHKIGDLEIKYHLFLIAKGNEIFNLAQSLDRHIYNLKNQYIESGDYLFYVSFKYEIFKPFESPEFEKEEFLSMKSILTAKTVLTEERKTINVKPELV